MKPIEPSEGVSEEPKPGESTLNQTKSGTEAPQVPSISGDNESNDVTGNTNTTENADGATGNTSITENADGAGITTLTEDSNGTGGIILPENADGSSTAESTAATESVSHKTETVSVWSFDESEFTELTETDDLNKEINEEEFDVEWNSHSFLLPSEILSLYYERHLRAEDPDWALRPVPELGDTIVRAMRFGKGPELENLLKNTNPNQRERIIKSLPLDIPLKYTLPIEDFEEYWNRKCTDKWTHCPVWRYNDEWKTLFIERTVQESVENYVPEESDLSEFKDTLDTFKDYVTRLKISRLIQRKIEPLSIDLSNEDFDEYLDNFLGYPDSTSVFVDFEMVLGTLSGLKEFYFILIPKGLDSNQMYQLSTKDFNSLFRGLKKLEQLEEVRFSNGVLTTRQMTMVLKMFFKHAHLQVLNLSYNFLDDRLCDCVARLLLSACPLKTLVLKDNRITNEGAETLAAVLLTNKVLEQLDLSMNWIQDEGGMALAKVMATDSALKSVDVSENKLTAIAGEAFADALCRSSSIRYFRINRNNLGEDMGRPFLLSAVENQGLLTLEVKDCLFTTVDENAILKAVLENRSRVSFAMYD